ncbi:YrhB domain-containing protein [Streptomyces sp. NPDC057381]|uniref:YrhB domain-containing protein n=1 Tax=Streptomyces sp. NPDC057381 TaxID=3346111 RepID=UPI00362DD9E5
MAWWADMEPMLTIEPFAPRSIMLAATVWIIGGVHLFRGRRTPVWAVAGTDDREICWSLLEPVGDAARVIERDAAVRIVEEELERDHQRQLAAGMEPMRMAVAHVEQHELVWVVSWTSEEYLRTRNPDFMLAGNGPYLVDRLDGSLHQVGVVSAVTEAWVVDYRVRIRGQAVRTAVDDLHDELRAVAAARGRIHAMHTLRQRLPVLTHAQVIEYVTALRDGDPPIHLVEVANRELVPPVDPVLSVETIRGPAEC